MNHIKALIAIVFTMASLSTYASCNYHKDFIFSMKKQVDSISVRESKKDIYAKLQEIIQNSVNTKEISRFVMGKYGVLATEKEKEDFLKEYEIYITRFCVKILYQHINSEMTIMSARAIDDETCLIGTRFSSGNEEFTNADFKVTKNGDYILISDVVMSGISISINQRSKFYEKIDERGIVSVIEELKCNNSL
ncbi:MAG: hypothetical protein PG981_001214 [Wolbachia endosymbiont of Ctenocephalides orientis wCori]|nr:MAG: hypothetical protein PG981_001214 [Wolbachia endosymbiont of Ctenocephalides orientis wCori]